MVDAKLKAAGYSGGYKNDGKRLTVGLYFRQEVFDRLHVGFVTFDKPHWVHLPTSMPLGGDGPALDGVDPSAYGSQKGAVLALIRHKATMQPVLVVSVHLDVPKDSAGRPSTQQQKVSVEQMMAKIKDILQHPFNAKALGLRPMETTPIAICGDFNCVPELLVGQELGSDAVAADCADSIAPPDTYHRMVDPLDTFALASAYATVVGKEPCYTSVKPTFLHTIDYIFYSTATLLPTYALDVVDARRDPHVQCGSGSGSVPAVPWPSDHLPLVSSFQFLQQDGAVLTEAEPCIPSGAPNVNARSVNTERQRPQCRFGAACRYHTAGTCRFAHD
jgi:endonuclease/exonuclease/phosphatase family metal-dependent hydrolase